MLLPGCIQTLGAGTGYAQDYRAGLTNLTMYDPSTWEQCKLGQCVCLACKNQTSWFGFRNSFAGGTCTFVQNCSQDVFDSLINGSMVSTDNMPRPFMIGQGYTFTDFADANGWCGNRLDMAVQWLVGTNETNYTLPDESRAQCFLQYDVMPVYVLYSNSQSINVPVTAQIAGLLKNAGPVIITTEMDFNSSSQADVVNVSEQVLAIDSACDNERTGPEEKIHCFVALGVTMGDYNGVNEVRQQLGPANWNKVDLIAFGINGHTVNLNWTNEAACDPDAALQQALSFARFSLYNNSKPTIIPYILFDSSGTDANGSCNWSEASMVQGYGDVFKYWLFPFQKAGVIGIAPYDFNSSSEGLGNPLGCTDCALGTQPDRMQAWFGSCRNYKIQAGKYPAGDNMIVFPNESGGTCDFNLNAMGMLQAQYTDQGEQITPNLTAPNLTLIRCDDCVNENYTFPANIPATDIGLSDPTKNFTYCSSVPALDYYANKWSVDPMLVRAVVIAESNFNNCSAALVSPTGQDSGCYPKGYDYVPDPEGNCPGTGNQVQGERYCGLGLMQSLEPPYTFWPSSLTPNGQPGQYYSGAATGSQLYLEANLAGRSTMDAQAQALCSPYFDPFNATNSACIGVYKLMTYLQTEKNTVKNNQNNLGNPDSNTQQVIAYYLALQLYRGYGGDYIQSWISEFARRYSATADFCNQDANKDSAICVERTSTGHYTQCYGMTDFVGFVRTCMFQNPDGSPGSVINNPQQGTAPFYGDYASRVLSYYQALVAGCGSASSCPSWKTLQIAAGCKNYPINGTPANSLGQPCVYQ
jgi:hypothetical protein